MKRRFISLLLVALLVMSILPVAAFAENPAKNITVNGSYTDGELTSVTVEFGWKVGFAQASGAKATLQQNQMDGEKTTNTKTGDFSDGGAYATGTKSVTPGLFLKEAVVNGTGGAGIVDSAYDHSVTMGDIDKLAAGRYFVYLWVNYQGKFYPDCLLCVIDVPASGTASYIPADTSGDLRNEFNESEKTDIQDKDNPAPVHTHAWSAVTTGVGSKEAKAVITCTADGCPLAGQQMEVVLTGSDTTLPANVFTGEYTVTNGTGANEFPLYVTTNLGYKYSADGTDYGNYIDPTTFEGKQGYYQASLLVLDGNVPVAELAVKYTVSDPVVTASTGDNRPIEMMMAGMALFSAMAAVAFVVDRKRRMVR